MIAITTICTSVVLLHQHVLQRLKVLRQKRSLVVARQPLFDLIVVAVVIVVGIATTTLRLIPQQRASVL